MVDRSIVFSMFTRGVPIENCPFSSLIYFRKMVDLSTVYCIFTQGYNKEDGDCLMGLSADFVVIAWDFTVFSMNDQW